MPHYSGEYKGVSYMLDTGHHPAGWTWALRIRAEWIPCPRGPLWPTEEAAIVAAEMEVEALVDRVGP